MNSKVLAIITDQTNALVSRIKQNIQTSGQYATGKSSESIYSLISESGGIYTIEVNAKPFFAVLETGRKPTPDKKPSREMVESIKEWTNAKGIPESAAWAIAVNINKNGTKLWQQGGRKDIYSNETESFTKEVLEALSKEIQGDFFEHVKQTFKDVA